MRQESKLLAMSLATMLLASCSADFLTPPPAPTPIPTLSPDKVAALCNEQNPALLEELRGEVFQEAIRKAEDLDNQGYAEQSKGMYLADASHSFSPDGQLDVYASLNNQIKTIDQSGQNTQTITNPPSGSVDFNPFWSTDGKKIVFIRSKFGQNKSDIYSIDSDGRNETRLTRNIPNVTDFSASFLANGRIIFVQNDESTGDDLGIFQLNKFYSIKPDGTDLQEIQLGNSQFYWNPMGIRLSPNHSKAAFSVSSQPEHLDLNPTRTSPPQKIDYNAQELYVTDGLAARKIDTRVGIMDTPIWTPDSQYVKYDKFDVNNKKTHYLAKADASIKYLCPPKS